MSERDLYEDKFIKYTKLTQSLVGPQLIGKTLCRLDRGYAEYGIVVGTTDTNLVVMHFPNLGRVLRINSCQLYIPKVILHIQSA